MSDAVVDLSNALARTVESAAPAVVRVDGRRRGPATGVAFRADGWIVTADHVLEWDEGIEVTLADGATLPATLVGRDPSTDLALLRVKAAGLPSRRGRHASKVGHLVLAVARPRTPGACTASPLPPAKRGERRRRSGGSLPGNRHRRLPRYSGSLLVNAPARRWVSQRRRPAWRRLALPPPRCRAWPTRWRRAGTSAAGTWAWAPCPCAFRRSRRPRWARTAASWSRRSRRARPPAAAACCWAAILAFDGSALSRPRDCWRGSTRDRWAAAWRCECCARDSRKNSR
jgi:hypothetical protein